MAPDAQRRTVAAQIAQPRSLLELYRSLLRIRGASDALLEGAYAAVSTDPGLFMFMRQTATSQMLVIMNMAAEPRAFASGSHQGLTTNAWKVLLGTDRSPDGIVDLEHLRLDPFEALLLGLG
jgi:glycosidase